MRQLPYLICLATVYGSYLTGNHSRTGFAIKFGCQVAWVAYAIALSEWPLIHTAVAFGAMEARNYFKWKREAAGQAAP